MWDRAAAPRLVCGFLAALLLTAPSAAQSDGPGSGGARECREDLSEADGYTIRSAAVDGRWVPPIQLPTGPYSPVKVTLFIEAVTKALNAQSHFDAEIANLGAVSVRYVDACVTVVDPDTCVRATGQSKCVDITVRPWAIRVDLLRVGNNVLPIPRANRATFFSGVPPALLALNPTAGLEVDRRYGTSQSLSFGADFLTLPSLLRGDTPVSGPQRLDFEVHERKSFDQPFHGVGGKLGFSLRHPGSAIDLAAIDARFTSDLVPQGTGQLSSTLLSAGGVLSLRSQTAFLDAATLSLRGRWSENKTSGGDVAQPRTTEGGVDATGIVDARVWDGLGRAALWVDAGMPSSNFGFYQRMAGMIGYAKEVSVAPNQSIGVEVLLGGGHTWGDVPEYARYFGGSAMRNYLYDRPSAEPLRSMPAGPLIRSFGERTLAARSGAGATRYWHSNLNVALPIPFLSRPLIPDEQVLIGNDTLSLKDMLKNAVHGERELFAKFLQKHDGLSPDEASTRAESLWSRLDPAVRFITDQANIYAVKPLFMADVAGIDTPGTGSRTLAGLGGGIQFTVVTARFEAGYMRTINPSAGDNRGNFFLRLTFQNLF